jgi:hypothetical protein
MRADDPAEVAEAAKDENARSRAKRVYDRIEQRIFAEALFQPHLTSRRLCFYVHKVTPLGLVWIDDEIFFKPYLPFIADKDCPEYQINRWGKIGVRIASSIEALLKGAEKVDTVDKVRDLAAVCLSPLQSE